MDLDIRPEDGLGGLLGELVDERDRLGAGPLQDALGLELALVVGATLVKTLDLVKVCKESSVRKGLSGFCNCFLPL